VRFAFAVVASLALAASASAAARTTRVTVYRPFVSGKLSPLVAL
jgi:hypothetical protein